MFPIPWNRAFRKKDGTLVNIVDAMSGGGGESELPDYSVADAGKVLKVGDDGSLEWDTSGSGGGIYTSGVIRPALYGPSNNTKFKIGSLPNPPSKGAGLTIYSDTAYEISDLIDFSIGNFIEMQNYMTSDVLTALNGTLLANVITASTSVELSHSFTDYDVIILEGVYDASGGTSGYDTCMLQRNTEVNTPYWFGVKDRNNAYSGEITFIDSTHATLSSSRRIRIYGFNL